MHVWSLQHIGSPMYGMNMRIVDTREAPQKWNRETFGHVKVKVHKLTVELEVEETQKEER